jgi:hypothetical protein
MKKINNIILALVIITVLSSCGGFSEAGKVLRNEKTTNSDEFLVKKREPLVLPPEYNTLPTPGSENAKKNEDQKKINQILNIPSQQPQSKKSSSVEESIINRIGK